jgi:hypothetical protein
MITYSKTKIDQRWDNMPKNLREVLYSPAYGETVFQIAKDYHLDERKSEIVVRLVGFVLYGFIHPEELDEKMVEEIDIDKNTAEEISDKLNKKIFDQFRKEISEIYSPVSEDSMQVESIKKPSPSSKPKKPFLEEEETEVDEDNLPEPFYSPEENKGFEKKSFTKDKPSFKRPVFERKTKGSEETKPFVIHRGTEKEPSFGENEKQGPKKSFSLGDFFGKEQKDKSFSAKIQTPFNKNKEDEKIVNYSEYRNTLEPDKKKNFINIPEQKEEIGKEEEIQKPLQLKNKIPASENKKKNKKEEEKKGSSGPSVKGNVIDLRNL